MIYQNQFEKDLYDPASAIHYPHGPNGPAEVKPRGPSTYLHAGSSKGWPHDHKAEDTFDLPSKYETAENFIMSEYSAEFTSGGGAVLVHRSVHKTTIASFNNFADAQTAAKALNELKGY